MVVHLLAGQARPQRELSIAAQTFIVRVEFVDGEPLFQQQFEQQAEDGDDDNEQSIFVVHGFDREPKQARDDEQPAENALERRRVFSLLGDLGSNRREHIDGTNCRR